MSTEVSKLSPDFVEGPTIIELNTRQVRVLALFKYI